MKKRHLIYVLFVMLLIVASCANGDQDAEVKEDTAESSVSEESADDDDAFPVTLEIDGEQITIEEKPQHILPLSLEMAEIVLELVDPSHVTAVTRGVDDPYLSTQTDVSDDIPHRVGAAVNIDPEEIISYNTDLLLLTKMYGEQEDAEKTLSQLDTPILSFDAIVTVDQFMEAFTIIGKALGEKDKADEIVANMKDDIASIQETIPEDESPTVLVLSEVGGDMGPFMMGPTNISYDLIQLAGATPAVDSIGLERSTPAAIEQVLKVDPDYILLLDFFGRGEENFAELMKDPGWNTLQAVQNDRIKMVEAKYILNPNVQNIEGLKILTDWLYQPDES